MNVTGFSDDNDTFVGNRSVYDEQQWHSLTTIEAIERIIKYVVIALGIPGNVLSAIVWMRRHIASESPPAIYFAALCINDLVFLICMGVLHINSAYYSRYILYRCVWYVWIPTAFLEPLLVLSFSVVRLIAIRRPLQVCCIALFFINRQVPHQEMRQRTYTFLRQHLQPLLRTASRKLPNSVK